MKRYLILFFALAITSQVYGFKVVGYLPSYRFYALENIDFTKLTHVMVSFANPNLNGEFEFSGDISKVVEKAAPNNCQVFISIGGGGLSKSIEEIYETQTEAAHRSSFINKLMNFARTNEVDGIDVDLESNMVLMETYDDFVQELIDSAHASNMEVSAAYAKWTGESVENATVSKLDFLNIMAYDLTGPWTGEGQHSPMSQASGDFNYWENKGANSEDLVIGVPFYGWEFQADTTFAWTWCQIVSSYPDSLNQDVINTGSGKIYFNGHETIKDKVQYAADNAAGGIMIWELGQDCFNNSSLLDVIDEKVSQAVNIYSPSKDFVKVYPNPTTNFLSIDLRGEHSFNILDLTGKSVLKGFSNEGAAIDVTSISSGMYVLQVKVNSYTYTSRLVKK